VLQEGAAIRAKLIHMVELIQSSRSPSMQELEISPVPALKETEQLVADLAIQAAWLQEDTGAQSSADVLINQLRSGISMPFSNSRIEVVVSGEVCPVLNTFCSNFPADSRLAEP